MNLIYNWFCVVTALCTTRVSGGRPNNSGVVHFPQSDEDQKKEIPLDMARLLNDIADESDLLRNFIDSQSRPRPDVISARFGGGPIERKAIRTAKAATCMPEAQTVPLKPNADATVFYYPSCTRVQRCGGCCSHELLSCQPVESEILQLGVVVTEYRGGSQLTYRGKDIVSVEQHTKCKCDCRIKEADCSPYQRYDKDSCRCICNNHDKEAKCNEELDIKLWSPSQCACVCRDPRECSTGFYFDKFTCECVQEKTRRNNATVNYNFDRWNYNVHN